MAEFVTKKLYTEYFGSFLSRNENTSIENLD